MLNPFLCTNEDVCAKDERNSIKNFALYEFLCKFAINIHLKRIAYDIKNMITTG